MILLIIPLISADVILPGHHPITVINKITNIIDYPNYVFISAPPIENQGPGLNMCPIKIVEEGIISNQYYKLCDLSIFVIEKDKWDIGEAQKFMEAEDVDYEKTYSEYFSFMESISAKEVIKNIHTYKTVSDSSTVTEEINTYAIDLSKVKIEPDNVKKEIEYLKTIIYVLISLISLAIIITILVKRKK